MTAGMDKAGVQPVDVLVAMRDGAKLIPVKPQNLRAHRDLHNATSFVAELIDAAEGVLSADDGDDHDEYTDACARLRAALARCGGAK